jgi:hypothetical protein
LAKESEWRQGVAEVGWASGPYALVVRLIRPHGAGTHFAWVPIQYGGILYVGTVNSNGFVPAWGQLDTLPKFPGRYEYWTGRESY